MAGVSLKQSAGLALIPLGAAVFADFLAQRSDYNMIAQNINQFIYDLIVFVGAQYLTTLGALMGLSAYYSHKAEKSEES